MDRDIVVRARAGDRDAFSLLAAASIGRLNAVARLIVRDDGRAEDAVQDALVDAWLDLPALRDPDRFDAWLNRLLINACHNVARRSGRQMRVEVSLLPIDSPAVPDTQTTSAIADEIERGFRRLTIEQRAVLVLVYYLDLSLADAAATLGVPVGTLKSRLNRSLKALRASLEADERPSRFSAENLA